MLRYLSVVALMRAFIAAFLLFGSAAYAQTALLDEVHTVGGTQTSVPVEHSFDVSIPGKYEVVLTDLGAPGAPLSSVTLAVTSGNTVVSKPLTAAGALQFTAAVGTYVIHVVGKAGSAPGSGIIGIQVNNMDTSTTLASFSDALASPSAAIPSGTALINDEFTVSSSGNYQIALADFQFPVALTTLTLAIAQEGGGLVGTPLAAAGSTTVSLQTGVNYRIFAVGVADTTANAGLYSAVLTPSGGGAPVYSRVVPVGAVTAADSVAVTAGSYSLTATDLAFPSALTSLVAVGVIDGSAVVNLTAAGTQNFTATVGTLKLFALGIPPSAASGSYALTVSPQGGSPVLSAVRAVSAPDASTVAYEFDAALTAAGTYSLTLGDLGFPANFTSIKAGVAQAGAQVGTGMTAPGTQNSLALSAGTAAIVVFAQPATGGGLFGLDLTASGASSSTFSVTQGVGQLFDARQITVTTAGSYTVNVTDLAFPAAFTNLAAIVSQGNNRVGSIFTGGSFAFTASPGKYFVNFIAQPGGTADAGTYAINVAPTPPAPTVSLSSSAASVSSGGTVKLTWSSQNASSCTATGGWTGSRGTSGSETSSALTASTTFTLACTGAGGTANQSVTVSIDPPKSSGGGSIDPGFLLIGLLLVLSRAVTRARGLGHH